MSDAQKAAEAYVEETDFIDNHNRRLAGNAFLAGAAWQREQDAKIAQGYADARAKYSGGLVAEYIRDDIRAQGPKQDCEPNCDRQSGHTGNCRAFPNQDCNDCNGYGFYQPKGEKCRHCAGTGKVRAHEENQP